MDIGLISDTHGLIRDEALAALAGSTLILHAGDIGDAAVLAALRGIAPVIAVRGNNDTAPWAQELAEQTRVPCGGVDIELLHDLKLLRAPPALRVVVSGHTHRPKIETRDGVLYINPGSAGPRRFQLPISVARLQIVRGEPRASLLTLG